MKTMKGLAVLGGACLVILAAAPLADAGPAFVLNPGEGKDDIFCSFFPTDPYQGTGDATVVINDGGKIIIACNGELDNEPPDNIFRYGEPGPLGTFCEITITPSGRFSVFCKN